MLRVRQILSSLIPSQRTRLIELLPKEVLIPLGTPVEAPRPVHFRGGRPVKPVAPPVKKESVFTGCGLFPNALKTQLPAGEAASLLGCITERLLQYPVRELTGDDMFTVCEEYGQVFSSTSKQKIIASPTTARWLKSIEITRREIAEYESSPKYDECIQSFRGDHSNTIEIQGHPDIVGDFIVFEVKTTTRLEDSWVDFILQVFAYSALAPEKMFVSLVLPLQEALWIHDVTTWIGKADFLTKMYEFATGLIRAAPTARDSHLALAQAGGPGAFEDFSIVTVVDESWSSFDLEHSEHDCSQHGHSLEELQTLQMLEGFQFEEDVQEQQAMALFSKIGSHVNQIKSIPNTLSQLTPDRPWQIMISNPQGTDITITPREIATSKEIIKKNGLRVAVHAPYTINLCRPWNDPTTLGPKKGKKSRCVQTNGSLALEKGKNEGYHIRCLRRTIEIAVEMGCTSVVFHLGKAVGLPIKDAIQNMKDNIERVLEHATFECPLLIETGCRVGTEVCSGSIREFLDFVDSIPDPRFGICLDSCHVHASGIPPVKALQAMIGRLRLIHFNDSKTPFGGRADRHAQPGTGFIGMETMIEIAKIADLNGIDMVME